MSQSEAKGNHIVLLEPEIPQNTGNIARTCAATGTSLHLIHPLGFSTDDKQLKRAGMDYWYDVDVRHYENWEDFLAKTDGLPGRAERFYYLTTKAPGGYSGADLSESSWFLFGKESAGIPEPILKANLERCIRIPMLATSRSLNLGNSAAIVLYEALRQQGFAGLQDAGSL